MAASSVVVIGNFDGVHRGHAELIRRARAAEPGARLVAVTFWPHPMSIVRPDHAPALLTSLTERRRLLEATGVDDVVVVEFTADVAGWSPERFVDEIIRPLHPVRVMVGENFRFGFRAAGDVDTLAELGRSRASDVFVVEAVPLLSADQAPDSSTRVREAIAAGDLVAASTLLGHDFRFTGVVVRGEQRGRELGFPTANIMVASDRAVPPDGIYAGWVRRLDTEDAPRWPAAISVGTNPTFDGRYLVVEAYVLDRTDLELYGVEIAVDFVARLRGQVRYVGVEELIAQMRRDVDQARTILGVG